MSQISYCIACKDRSTGRSFWLGGTGDASGAYWCDVESGPPEPGEPEYWSVVPVIGTDAYYLQNQSTSLYACFPGGGSMIALRPLDVFNPGFILRLDDVGDGWVALNDSARDNVFTAQPQPQASANVIQSPWQGSDAQLWKFVNAAML